MQSAIMSLPRELLYICCLGLSISLGQFEDAVMSPQVVTQEIRSSCSCGGFPTATPEPNVAPLLSQAPGLIVRCDDEGDFTCKSLCLALATATKAKGPEILCNRLKNVQELKVKGNIITGLVRYKYRGECRVKKHQNQRECMKRIMDVIEAKQLSAFYKLCDRPWTYANMTAVEPLCCEESKFKPCPSAE